MARNLLPVFSGDLPLFTYTDVIFQPPLYFSLDLLLPFGFHLAFQNTLQPFFSYSK